MAVNIASVVMAAAADNGDLGPTIVGKMDKLLQYINAFSTYPHTGCIASRANEIGSSAPFVMMEWIRSCFDFHVDDRHATRIYSGDGDTITTLLR